MTVISLTVIHTAKPIKTPSGDTNFLYWSYINAICIICYLRVAISRAVSCCFSGVLRTKLSRSCFRKLMSFCN